MLFPKLKLNMLMLLMLLMMMLLVEVVHEKRRGRPTLAEAALKLDKLKEIEKFL